MSTPQSDTPRTDAAEQLQNKQWEDSREIDWPAFPCDFDFARTLERELAAASARVRELEGAASVLLADIDHCGQWVAPTPALDRMRAALAGKPSPAPTYYDRPDRPGRWWRWLNATKNWEHLWVSIPSLTSAGIWTPATPPPPPRKEEQP